LRESTSVQSDLEDLDESRKRFSILLIIVGIILLFSSGALAEWAFVVLGDTREDYKRAKVFPEMIREVNPLAVI
jgi:hypothetical protein